MHSEDVKDSEKLLEFNEGWAKQSTNVTDANQKFIALNKLNAEKHYDILVKFGRYPHRNAALQRESTPEEIEYLKNADTFGQ